MHHRTRQPESTGRIAITRTSSAPKLFLDSNENDLSYFGGRFNFRFVRSRRNHSRHGPRRGQDTDFPADDAGGRLRETRKNIIRRTRVDYNAMRDFVVYVKGGLEQIPRFPHVQSRDRQYYSHQTRRGSFRSRTCCRSWPAPRWNGRTTTRFFMAFFPCPTPRISDPGALQRNPRGQASITFEARPDASMYSAPFMRTCIVSFLFWKILTSTSVDDNRNHRTPFPMYRRERTN